MNVMLKTFGDIVGESCFGVLSRLKAQSKIQNTYASDRLEDAWLTLLRNEVRVYVA